MTDEKIDEKIRLGGMALPNGVLVHGPKSWACAIRREDGQVEVASALKRFRAANVNQAFLRGPLRLAEAMAILPQVKRALPLRWESEMARELGQGDSLPEAAIEEEAARVVGCFFGELSAIRALLQREAGDLDVPVAHGFFAVDDTRPQITQGADGGERVAVLRSRFGGSDGPRAENSGREPHVGQGRQARR